MIETALATLEALPGDGDKNVHRTDWDKLVASLPTDRVRDKARVIRTFFYPPQGKKSASAASSAGSTGPRRNGLLKGFSSDDYRRVCEYLVENPSTAFPNVSAILTLRKEEGSLLVHIMEHVVTWLNRAPSALYNGQRKNKPLLREDFLPTLAQLSSDPDAMSIELEQTVLDFSRTRLAELSQPAVKHFLAIMPKPAGIHDEKREAKEAAEYAERFVWPFWSGLLDAVFGVLGPSFQPWWTKFAVKDGPGVDKDVRSSFARTIGKTLGDMPEVAQNPALSSKGALDNLVGVLDGVVLRWAAKQCREGLRRQQDGGQPSESLWPVATTELVKAAEASYRQLVESQARHESHDETREERPPCRDTGQTPSSPLFTASPPPSHQGSGEDVASRPVDDGQGPGSSPDLIPGHASATPEITRVIITSRDRQHTETDKSRGTRRPLPSMSARSQSSEVPSSNPSWAAGVPAMARSRQ